MIKIFLILLFVCACENKNVLTATCDDYNIYKDSSNLMLRKGNLNEKYVKKNGEFVDKTTHGAFLTVKRNVFYKERYPTIWGNERCVRINKVELGPDTDTSNKLFERVEYVQDSSTADGQWPLREIYFDENYDIIKIILYDNVNFKR